MKLRELAISAECNPREVTQVEKRYPLKSSPRTFGHMVTPRRSAVNDKPLMQVSPSGKGTGFLIPHFAGSSPATCTMGGIYERTM